MAKISTSFIDNEVIHPNVGQLLIRDDELKGFGLRVTKNCIAFIVERRISGQVRRITIGKYGQMLPEEARQAAQKILSEKLSRESVDGKMILSTTLAEVLAKFLALRKLRPNTVRAYSQMTKRCLGDWLHVPVASISKEMVQARHSELTRSTKQGSSGEVQANMAMRILRTLLNFAANNYETSDGQPIITANPVRRLSQNRSWHLEPRRRIILPDHKLGDWYRAVMALKQTTVRDYLLFLLLTGLRRNEAGTVRWKDVDFEAKTITIPAVAAKNKQEHCLPLSEFLLTLLQRRTRDSEFVFPGRGGHNHIVDPGHVVSNVIKNSGCAFVIHDLRRTFITMAAKLGVAHHIIKKLVNHITSAGATDGYIVLHVEHLREAMAQITNRFLTLFGCTLTDWKQDICSPDQLLIQF
jgi:integrase